VTPGGRPALDLGRSDFAVLEDGVPQTLTHFSAARTPITIALLIDASNSMRLGDRIAYARKGAEEFVDAVEPGDRLLVFWFDDTLHGENAPVSDRDAARERIRGIARAAAPPCTTPSTPPPLVCARSMPARHRPALRRQGPALTENEPGSLHLFEEALATAHRSERRSTPSARAAPRPGDRPGRLAQRARPARDFRAADRGPRLVPGSRRRSGEVYRQIARGSAAAIHLGYVSTNTALDGRWRRIAVQVARPGLAVEARAGYYAPGPGAPEAPRRLAGGRRDQHEIARVDEQAGACPSVRPVVA